MVTTRTSASLIGGVGLLERAVNYTLGSLHCVTPEALSHPTPCRDWDLGALLRHLNESLLALHEAIDIGQLDLDGAAPGLDGDPVAAVRDRARRMLGAWTAGGRRSISVAGCPLTTSIVSGTGAVEIAVHGWDVAQACGEHRPIPQALAEELLPLAALFVTTADRPVRFAPAVEVPALAGPSDRLIAFLGRHPG